MTKLLDLYQPTLDERRRTHGFSDDFVSPPPRQRLSYVQAALANGADLAAKVIFSPGVNAQIHGITITPDGSSTGIDNTNTSTWAVTDGSNTIVSKLYDNLGAGEAFPADNVQTSLGTPAYSHIASGGRLELAVTNGTGVSTPAAVVDVEYTDVSNMNGWKLVATDDGVFSYSDAVGGRISLTPSDATVADNDEIYLFRANETFKFAANKPVMFDALVQYAEAATDDANILVAMKDAWAADSLVNDGAGPATSFSGFGFYKVDGETRWRVISSKSTTQYKSETDVTAGGSAFQRLVAVARPINSTQVEVAFFIDSGSGLVQCRDYTSGDPIKHVLDYSSATEMAFGFGVKNGGSSAETLVIDSAEAHQER